VRNLLFADATPDRGCPILRALCEGACPELAEGCRKPQKRGWSRHSRPASTATSKAAGFSPRGAFRFVSAHDPVGQGLHKIIVIPNRAESPVRNLLFADAAMTEGAPCLASFARHGIPRLNPSENFGKLHGREGHDFSPSLPEQARRAEGACPERSRRVPQAPKARVEQAFQACVNGHQ
jgi:hypothetical protein